MSKQVCDISASTGMTRGQSSEHLRNYSNIDPDAKKHGFYDPTRTHLNFEVTKGGIISPVNKEYSLDKRFEEKCRQRNIKVPGPIHMKDGSTKDRYVLANIILGGSRDRMLKLAFGEQHVDLFRGADNRHIIRHEEIERWAIDQYNLMAKLYGEDNILSFIVHMDEKNPHVHCSIIPEVNGKISYKKMFVGKDKYEARQKFNDLHDSIAAVNAKWGLERGANVNMTGAKHRTTEEYLLWLREECNLMEKEKGSLNEKVSGLKASLKLLDGEIRRNEIKVKGLTTMICNLERRQEDLEADVLSSDLVLQQNEQQKKNLDVLIQSNQESLTRKRKELEEAKELLELLKKQQTEKGEYLAKINNELSHLKDELQFIKRDEFRTYKGRTYEAISNHLIKTATHFLGLLIDKVEPRLPQSYRFPFDNFVKESDLFCFSEGSEEIIESALSIFLGGKDEIGAELLSSAGGGNSSAGGWRKRDDEDEDAYLNRCVAMAFRRYKKSKGLIRK